MSHSLSVLVGIDDNKQHEHYAEALEKRIQKGRDVTYRLGDLGRHDWLAQVEGIDLIFWHPRYMGPAIASHFKEKIWFLERHLGKTVIPGFDSAWHFESKVAQSYLFARYGVPTPPTTATFNPDEAFDLLARAEMPLVFKRPAGSGSREVWLVKTKKEGRKALARIFADQLWFQAEQRFGEGYRAALRSLGKRWFWSYLLRKLKGDVEPQPAYWQEFIPGNPGDLRILTIGDRFVSGFWRRNRPGDFRASGSGLIRYEPALPEEQVRECLRLNREFCFDSMAYDLLRTPRGFVITEMSYGVVERFVYNAPGYYELFSSGELRFVQGHTWPQELLVEWGLQKASARLQLPPGGRCD